MKILDLIDKTLVLIFIWHYKFIKKIIIVLFMHFRLDNKFKKLNRNSCKKGKMVISHLECRKIRSSYFLESLKLVISKSNSIFINDLFC